MLDLINKVTETREYFLIITMLIMPINGLILSKNKLIGVLLICLQIPYFIKISNLIK